MLSLVTINLVYAFTHVKFVYLISSYLYSLMCVSFCRRKDKSSNKCKFSRVCVFVVYMVLQQLNIEHQCVFCERIY
jgi:hypothetical protein